MSFFKRLQKFNVVWKKAIVAVIIIVLAVPLLIFIGNNFQKRARKFQEKGLFEELKVPELQQEIEGSFEGLKKEMGKIATTTTTTIYAEEETTQTTE